MKSSYFNYVISNDNEITKHIIYDNYTFDINKVYTKEHNERHTSMSVITPTQKVSVDFDYYCVPGGHAGITDLILSRIYPKYKPCILFGDQQIYFDNSEFNIFIITIKNILCIIMPPKINDFQYKTLCEFVKKLQNTDYAKKNNIECYINDDSFSYSELDSKISNIKKNITAINIPEQYEIANFSTTPNKKKEEILKDIEYYIETTYKSNKNKNR